MLLFIIVSGLLFIGPVRTQYGDSQARYLFYPAAISSYFDNPLSCLNNFFNNITLVNRYQVPCNLTHANETVTCASMIAIDYSDKAIIISFRGTVGTYAQYNQENSNADLVPFPEVGGSVDEYFLYSFRQLWSSNMSLDYSNVRNQLNGFDVWVVGHSLGGAMASLAAAFISSTNILPVNGSIKLVTFGQPRTGDSTYATAVDNLLLFTYRVINHNDIVPHLPLYIAPFFEYVHHGNEVWYFTNMSLPATFMVCPGIENPNCSDVVALFPSFSDHVTYFDANLTNFISSNCSYNASTIDIEGPGSKAAKSSSLGLDSVNPISVSTFKCLAENGYTMFTGRVSKNDGTVDMVGIQNILNAKKAGFAHTSAYYTPCANSTDKKADIDCAYAQMDTVVNALAENKAPVDVLWADLELSLLWWTNTSWNQGYVNGFTQLTNDYLVETCGTTNYGCNTTVGVYTTEKIWNTLFGTDFKNDGFKLWWVNYDGQQNYDNFHSFGGWNKPYMHQYAINAKGPCGMTLDLNWME